MGDNGERLTSSSGVLKKHTEQLQIEFEKIYSAKKPEIEQELNGAILAIQNLVVDTNKRPELEKMRIMHKLGTIYNSVETSIEIKLRMIGIYADVPTELQEYITDEMNKLKELILQKKEEFCFSEKED